MGVVIEGIETAFNILEPIDGETVFQGFDTEGNPAQKYQMAIGDTFHISYDLEVDLWTFFVSWLTNKPIVTKARITCNCNWDKKTQ